MLNTDVLNIILTKIIHPNTYMNCLYVCSSFYSFLMRHHEDKIKSFNLGIVGLCRRYPLLPWNNGGLNYNKSVSLRDVLNYPNIFKMILKNNTLITRLIEQGVINNDSDKELLNTKINEHLPLNFITYIVDNSLFSFKSHYHNMWIHVVSNKNVKFDTMFNVKCYGMDIPTKMTISDIVIIIGHDGFYDCMSDNENININYLLNNQSLNWDWYNLSRNKGISINDIMRNPLLPWDWYQVLYHPKITMKDIIKYYDVFDWNNEEELPTFPNITFEEVMTHNEQLQWDNEFICRSVVITKNDLIKYNTYTWNTSISNNFSVTEEMIDYGREIGIEWDYANLSTNNNITIKYVLNNIEEKWNWFHLSKTLKQ